jgi:hypothetical protein
MLTFNDAQQVMLDRGYSLLARSSDGSWFTCTREVLGVTLTARVDISAFNTAVPIVTIVHTPPGDWAQCRFETGSLALMHPNYEKYERYVVKAALALGVAV